MEYFVKTPVRFQGRRYMPGETIDLSDVDAKSALASGAIQAEPIVNTEAARVEAPAPIQQDAPAEPSVGGTPMNSGEPSVDGQSAQQTRAEAVDVTPVTVDMKRDELEAVAEKEGMAKEAIEAAGTKAELVDAIEKHRAAPAPQEETQTDVSADL